MKSLLLVPALAGLALLASVKDCKDRVCPRGMTMEVSPTGEAKCVCREGHVPAPDGVGCVMPPTPPPTPEPSVEPTPEPSPLPSPSPSTEPSPTPEPSTSPGPSPSSGPTPAACPLMACIDAKVHIAAGPGGLLPHPTACVDPHPARTCRVVLDATAHWGRCLPVWTCDDDHHGPCTAEGHPTHQTHTCAPNCSEENPCRAYRRCDDPRGHVWRKLFAPANVQWNVQNPGPDRGYQVVIQTPVAGSYAWEVCAASPLDGEGQPVTGSTACGRVEFEVR